MLKEGGFVLSIDTELAWGGVHNQQFHHRKQMFEVTRDVISRLLRLQEEYGIRATWAVVGHLFLDRCRPVDGVKHPELVRPEYPWFSGDWFQYDPCTDVGRDPFWYGPDIVEKILGCSTPQEIGCHGFSHVIIGEPGCSKSSFESELKASQEVAESWGLTLKSFVFPRNAVGHLDVLAENGFTSFRGTIPPGWRQRLPGPARRVIRSMDNVFSIPPIVAAPEVRDGLWNVPGTSFYLHRDGWAGKVPISFRVHKARVGLRQAVNSKSIFHLWFHPFNVASDPDGLLDGLESIFKEVARLREKGVLANPTMEELALDLDTLSAKRKAAA